MIKSNTLPPKYNWNTLHTQYRCSMLTSCNTFSAYSVAKCVNICEQRYLNKTDFDVNRSIQNVF